MEPKIIITSDGSHSLNHPLWNETYHSIHGSITESLHIFIESGLLHKIKSCSFIRILEVGFGTGLNAFLTRYFCELHKIHIIYHAIELYPLPKHIYSQLNYAQIFNKTNIDYFLSLHQAEWEKDNFISPFFTLHKYNTSILNFPFPPSFYDLVYYDAFAPQFQPEMWTKDVFDMIYYSMVNGAILTTYCCKGEVKRALKNAGFTIEKLPGPKGKREILKAEKYLPLYSSPNV